MSQRPYYTLFCREPSGQWFPQFGDYVRAVVLDESRDYYREYKGKDKRIVKTTETQAAIEQARNELNAAN